MARPETGRFVNIFGLTRRIQTLVRPYIGDLAKVNEARANMKKKQIETKLVITKTKACVITLKNKQHKYAYMNTLKLWVIIDVKNQTLCRFKTRSCLLCLWRGEYLFTGKFFLKNVFFGALMLSL